MQDISGFFRIKCTVIFIILSGGLFSQDICDDAIFIGTLGCDNFLFDVIDDPNFTPDPEAFDCVSGPTGWLSFDVLPGVDRVFVAEAESYNLFYGSCGNLTAIGSNCNDLTLPIQQGETHYILVDGFGSVAAEPYINQECSRAANISGNSITTNLSCASPSSGQGCSGDHSLWFVYEISNDKTKLTIKTESSTGTAYVSAYVECGVAEIEPLNDACSETIWESDCLTSGTIMIELMTETSDLATDVTMTITENIITDENDDCLGAEEIFDDFLRCGMSETVEGPSNGSCSDIESTDFDCVERGIWYTFSTEEVLPVFNVSGENIFFLLIVCRFPGLARRVVF